MGAIFLSSHTKPHGEHAAWSSQRHGPPAALPLAAGWRGGSPARLSRGRGRSGGGWRVREARERLLPARRGKALPMNGPDFIQKIPRDRLVQSPRKDRKSVV